MSRNMRYANNYQGLKKRKEYDEIVDYLNNGLPKNKYPDRQATFLRNTNQLSNMLDGDGYSMFAFEMQQQQNMLTEQQKMQTLLKMGKMPTPAPTPAPSPMAALLPQDPRSITFGGSDASPMTKGADELGVRISAEEQLIEKKRELFKPYFDGEGGDPLDIAHQYAQASAALLARVSAEKKTD